MERIKTAVLLLLAAALTLTPGCADLNESDKLTIVPGLGFDRAGAEYALITEIVSEPEAEGSAGKPQSSLIDSRGGTITEAINNNILLSGNILYYAHVQVIVIGREAAERGIWEYIDYVNGQNSFRLMLRPVVADGSAAELMQAKALKTDVSSFELREILASNERIYRAPDIPIYRLANDILEEGIEGILPLAHIEDNQGEPTSKIAGTALFVGDRLAGTLDETETQYLLWLRGKVEGGTVTLGKDVFEVIEGKTSLECGRNTVKIKLSVRMSAEEGSFDGERTERELKELIESDIAGLVKKLQTLGCDAAGFGRRLKRANAGEWREVAENWREQFGRLEVTVEAEPSVTVFKRTNR